ncbi:MAG: hypothetical protein F4090_02175 [Nitrospira sp. SB0672_bin_25]|nr:hypothetical protein [Nitrospira sp. SB0666_bin_27]MYF24917.1 hypothetical protein [Nitrospira sp. SB0678_bin_10]MYJ53712.1 hypothetical protein [Nitrospira sp. SB0672_bin_25]
MDTKRFFLYFIVITALALAGCGGNGGGTPDPGPDPMPMPDPCPAGQERNADGDCVTPPPPGPTAEELTARADTKRKAIAAEAAQTTDAGLGGSARDDTDGTTTADDASDDPYTLAISRDRDGTEVKITDDSMAGDDDPKFMQAMDLGGGTTMHVRKMKADEDGDVMEEVVMVTTDIEAPKATAFGKVAGQTLNANAQGAAVTGVAAVGFDPGAALASTDDAQAMILANIKAGSFVSGSSTSALLTFDAAVADDVSTTDEDETKAAAEVMGTYNGAMGIYKCTGTTDCTVNVNAKGELSAMSDGWVFFPAAGATSDVADSDYMHYGFWLKRTTDKDGVLTYNEVETFAGSSLAASTGSELDSVTGSATYSGGATGVYVHSTVNPDGTEASATSGHFTATANLTAYFAQTVDDTTTGTTDNPVDESGQVAPNMLNRITGTINNFMLSGGEANNWSVALRGLRAAGANTFTGTANGGGGSMGSLSGTYHGATPETDSTGDGATRVAPPVIVGEFNSEFSNGSVAGGFGARKNP